MKKTTSRSFGGKLNRSAWLVLGISILLVAVNLFQIVYRYTLPTDGWSYITEGDTFDEIAVVADTNLIGRPTELQQGDIVLEIGGIKLSSFTSPNPNSLVSGFVPIMPVPANWQVGGSAAYLIERHSEQQVVYVPIQHWTPQAFMRWNFSSTALWSYLNAFAFFGIAVFVFFKRMQDWAARVLLFFAAVLLSISLSGMLPDVTSILFAPLASIFSIFMSYWIWGILFTPTLFVFTLVFPQPKKFVRQYPILLVLPYAAFWILVLIFGARWEVGWGLSMAFFVLSGISILHSVIVFRDPVSRAQLRWPVFGIIFAVIAYLPTYAYMFGLFRPQGEIYYLAGELLTNLAFPVFLFSLAFAILRYRLWDIDIIIRKTLVYAVLTILLLVVYFGLVVLLQQVFGVITNSENSPIAIVISTLVIAALFNPLRLRLQNFIDRRFYRRKYDAEQTLTAFTNAARNETDLEHLNTELIKLVIETMQPEQVSLWQKNIPNRHVLKFKEKSD